MSKLCLGGSFNPVHFGHLICARYAAERLSINTVALIPSAQPPHKSGVRNLAPPGDRVRMCELAVAGSSDFVVDDLETRRTGPSYTIETARELARQGWGKVTWLIGADLLPGLSTWHEPEALLREVDFVLIARPGWTMDWNALPPAYRHLRERVIEAPLIEISATAIRQRVAEGRPISYLTPAPVVDYIHAHRLYRRD